VTDSRELARQVRRLSLEMVHRAGASHIGSALSIADIVAVLYGDVMAYDSSDPASPQRDRFILSKGHACVAVYAVLALRGFFPKKCLEEYGADFSMFMNHISHHVPGVEFSTGSLGHGLPFAVGKALACRMRGEKWRVYAVLSDGELDEGSNWEAFMFAAHHHLDRLTAIIDYNRLQSLGSVKDTLEIEPLAKKLHAFGWCVIEVDGHDHQALVETLSHCDKRKRPLAVIAHTTKGKGVGFMENEVLWHYRNPSDEELAVALSELGFDA